MANAYHTQPQGYIVKQLKVGEHHYPPLKHQHQSRPVPWLQLKGHWLKQVGFESQTNITVRGMPGCLVITLAK